MVLNQAHDHFVKLVYLAFLEFLDFTFFLLTCWRLLLHRATTWPVNDTIPNSIIITFIWVPEWDIDRKQIFEAYHNTNFGSFVFSDFLNLCDVTGYSFQKFSEGSTFFVLRSFFLMILFNLLCVETFLSHDVVQPLDVSSCCLISRIEVPSL